MIDLIAEAVGTFFLVLTIALSGDPLTIGFVLMVLVYAGAPLSGAHYNPAVTVALFLRNKINQSKTIRYILVQLLGSIVAAIVASIFHRPLIVEPSASVPWLTAVVGEALFTFLLVFVILQVAANKKTQGNQYFGFAIGGTVFVAASAMGKISGGAFNPAVGIGPLIGNVLAGNRLFDPSLFFLYIIGPVAGAVIAAYLHAYTQGEKITIPFKNV
jgi:aquaporin Z